MEAKQRKKKGRHERHKFNVRQIAGLTAPGIYSDGGGLYVRVRPMGSRSWLFIYTLKGKRTEIRLGSLLDVTLAQARERAASLRDMLVYGQNPTLRHNAVEYGPDQQTVETVAAQPLVKTFGAYVSEFLESELEGFKNAKHRQQWTNTLGTYAAGMADVPIADISTDHVLAALQPIWQAKPETARRLRGRIERVLDAAKVKGLRVGDNPARKGGHLALILPKQLKKVRHHPALPFDQVEDFFVKLGQRPAMAARALEFAILTASRSGEVRGMTWGEVDLKSKIWKVPANRMKAGVEHEVPLSDAAIAALNSVRPQKENPNAIVFPATRGGSLSDMALTQLLKRMGHGDITVHGFRSTFRDWAGETTIFDRETIEMALAHTVASATEAAYRRGRALAKRRDLMAAWADYVNGVTAPPAAVEAA